MVAITKAMIAWGATTKVIIIKLVTTKLIKREATKAKVATLRITTKATNPNMAATKTNMTTAIGAVEAATPAAEDADIHRNIFILKPVKIMFVSTTTLSKIIERK